MLLIYPLSFPQICVSYCATLGATYAGVQYGHEVSPEDCSRPEHQMACRVLSPVLQRVYRLLCVTGSRSHVLWILFFAEEVECVALERACRAFQYFGYTLEVHICVIQPEWPGVHMAIQCLCTSKFSKGIGPSSRSGLDILWRRSAC